MIYNRNKFLNPRLSLPVDTTPQLFLMPYLDFLGRDVSQECILLSKRQKTFR